MEPTRLRAVARRALARARAERRRGVPAVAATVPGAGGAALCVEDLEGVAAGTRLRLAPRTRVTPLARDEAWRRGIVLEETWV